MFNKIMHRVWKIWKHAGLACGQLQRSCHSAALKNPDRTIPCKSVYLETYGCQMNVSDSEVVLSILKSVGYEQTKEVSTADLVLLNTCAIREKPENKIWTRLQQIRSLQKTERAKSLVGVLGCMAERVKERLLDREKLADLVVGPDGYRDLPRLLTSLEEEKEDRAGAMNVALSLEESYADIKPLRQQGKVTAFLTIMRGCNNMCAFCIVPFTRGRERSRPINTILDEVKFLRDQGVKDITLLGQNVNSYSDLSGKITQDKGRDVVNDPFAVYASGFSSVYKPRREGGISFAELLEAVADVDEEIRIRFTSPHPKDFHDDVIDVVRSRRNICKQLHVPAQSGSTEVLRRMKRGYSRKAYDGLIARIRRAIPDVALSTDIIVGFSGETEEEHQETVDLMNCVGFDQAFMFKYSEREKTHAYRHLPDSVPSDVKQRRLQEVIDVFREGLHKRNQSEIGKRHVVLVEEEAIRDKKCLTGRSDTFKRVVFPKQLARNCLSDSNGEAVPNIGEYVAVRIESASHGCLYGHRLDRASLRELSV